jgi:hypothetical protein
VDQYLGLGMRGVNQALTERSKQSNRLLIEIKPQDLTKKPIGTYIELAL